MTTLDHFTTHLRTQVAEDKMEDTLKSITEKLECVEGELYNQALQLQAQERHLRQQSLTGLLSAEEEARLVNKLRANLLSLINDLETDTHVIALFRDGVRATQMEVTKKRPKQKIGSELNLKATKKRPTQKIAEGTKGKVFAIELSSTDRRVQNGENIFRVEKEATIGRSPDCDIVILDEYVSRKHAQIFIKDGKAYIKDLLSSNGTFFQERPVLQQMQIEEDGTLRVDTVEFNIKTLSV